MFLRKFGSKGDAPGEFKADPRDIAIMPDGNLVVGEYNYLHFFKHEWYSSLGQTRTARIHVSVAPDGTLFSVCVYEIQKETLATTQ